MKLNPILLSGIFPGPIGMFMGIGISGGIGLVGLRGKKDIVVLGEGVE